MAFKIVDCDNVRESFTSTGTTITAAGAVANSRALSAVLSNGDTFCGVARKGAEISVGIFTWSTGGSIAQTTVFYSTNGNAAVSFSSGTGEIFMDAPSRLFDHLNMIEITVTSAATTDIGAAQGLRIAISGTTGPITSFGTSANKMRIVRHSGSSITHHATSMILKGGVNRVTAANDIGIYVSDASGNWREIAYMPAAGNVSYGTDAATAAQQLQARANISAALKGQISGLTLSNNASDATNDIDIAVGEAASTETSPVLMVLASALTKRLDAAWAVGTNQGGLDTGAIANTTYHIFLIQRSDTGVVDALFSTSPTAPTMPTNYDRKRRIGAIVRVAASIKAFYQYGDEFKWALGNNDYNTAAAQSDCLRLRRDLKSYLCQYEPLSIPTVNVAVSEQLRHIERA